MFYLVPETGTRKIWYQTAWHTYQFLVPVSGQYVMGISLRQIYNLRVVSYGGV